MSLLCFVLHNQVNDQDFRCGHCIAIQQTFSKTVKDRPFIRLHHSPRKAKTNITRTLAISLNLCTLQTHILLLEITFVLFPKGASQMLRSLKQQARHSCAKKALWWISTTTIIMWPNCIFPQAKIFSSNFKDIVLNARNSSKEIWAHSHQALELQCASFSFWTL